MLPRVQVLLSCWNGAHYLGEQLASLQAQSYADRLTILIRDDGSTDATLDIARDYAARDSRIRLIEGPNVGVVRSFGILQQEADAGAQLFCFCDQDDLWLPDKIRIGVQTLGRAANSVQPTLYASRSMVTDQTLQYLAPTADYLRPPSFRNAMIQNIAPGHTMMANRPLLEASRDSYNDAIIMHDHWWYLIASGLGRVHFDHDWHALYRSHPNNVIGYEVGPIARIQARAKRLVTLDRSRYTAQDLAFRKAFAERLRPDDRWALEGFLDDQTSLGSRARYVKRFPLVHATPATSLVANALFLVGSYRQD